MFSPRLDMSDLAHRLSINIVWLYLSMVALLCIWETLAPRRQLLLSTPRRWLSHLILYFAAAVPFRLIGIGPLTLALARRDSSFGLLNRPEVPWLASFFATLLIIDLMRYGVHRLSHSVPWLWRNHLLHHSDRDFDFTNDLRFHPLDAALQFSGSILVVWILAPPPVAVAVSEALAIAGGMVAHANVQLPKTVERYLRWVVITPGLHQIHHSIDEREQGRNLGVSFVWWDRIFGTFAEVPAHGYDALRFGVKEVDAAECTRPLHMILAPFRAYKASREQSPNTIPVARSVGAQEAKLN